MQPELLLIIKIIKTQPWSKMNKFEAVLLISPETSNSVLSEIIKTFEEIVINNSGKIHDSEDWGLRDLSYGIKNFKKAFYRYFQLEINGNYIQKITKSLNQNDNIIRHIFIKVKDHEELPTKLNYAQK